MGQAGDEESVAHGTDLLFFASSLEGDAARRTSLVARLVAGTWEKHQRFRSPESLEATLNARRLVEQWTNSPGDPGQIRIEAHSITFSGIVDGQQGRSFPFSHLLPTAGSPSATVVSIGGVAVSPNPATFPDIVINKLTAVDVVIQTRNVPTTATIKLTILNENGVADTVITAPPLGMHGRQRVHDNGSCRISVRRLARVDQGNVDPISVEKNAEHSSLRPSVSAVRDVARYRIFRDTERSARVALVEAAE